MMGTARLFLSYLMPRVDRDERGATAVEYGLLVALIAAVIVSTVIVLGQKLPGGFTAVSSML